MFLQHPQGWWLLHLPGQPIPVPDCSLREVFPDPQPESPLAQLKAIPASPTTSYMGEEADSCLATTYLQVEMSSHSDRIGYMNPMLLLGVNLHLSCSTGAVSQRQILHWLLCSELISSWETGILLTLITWWLEKACLEDMVAVKD